MRFDLASEWRLSCGRKGIPEIPDPCIGLNENAVQWVHECDWTFAKEFELEPEFLASKVIFLNIDSIDTFGEIRINGEFAGRSENMFSRFRTDVKKLLKPGLNRIEILIKSPSRRALEESRNQPFELVTLKFMNSVPHMNLIRKVQCHGGWDWGITLVGSGLYGNIYLEGVENIRIEYVYTAQTHRTDRCTVDVTAELLAAEEGETDVEFVFNGEAQKRQISVQKGKNTVGISFDVAHPALWNPVGYGEQNLYTLKISTRDETVEKKIGLRTMELVTEPDETGVCMKVRVNGTDIFCKGANWIPMDCLPRNYTRENYRELIGAARDANMNMLRAWGGGLYENEEFYELCDELGILIWQDCMFSCSQYPSSREFLELVKAELEYQVKRLRDHASIAFWCGDNEVALGLRWGAPEHRLRDVGNYERLNYVIETAVLENDPTRQFWMSSPCGGSLDYDFSLFHGDTHSWEIWSGCKPFSAYYDIVPRFCSEFGFQALASMNAIRRFTEGKDLNMTSPVMEHHQRRLGADAKILTMFAHYFRMPSDFENTVYLSQVQQALAIKTGVEFWRSRKPVCMGALYWQLNDNWPVASWSGIDYYGNWKQLHYHAKRFFAPVIAVCVPDKEKHLEVSVSSDVPRPLSGSLVLRIMDFSGTILKRFEFPVNLKAQEAATVRKLDIAELAEKPDEVFAYLELKLTDGTTEYTHYNDFFFTEYKHCNLREAGIRHVLERKEELWHLTLESDFPAFFVFAELKDLPAVFSDNSFTLLPGSPRVLTFAADLSKEELERRLEIHDLRGSYEG